MLLLTCLVVLLVLAVIMVRGSAVGSLVVGALLLSRRSRQERGWDRRLLIGLFVAALPAILICLVALMYALRG